MNERPLMETDQKPGNDRDGGRADVRLDFGLCPLSTHYGRLTTMWLPTQSRHSASGVCQHHRDRPTWVGCRLSGFGEEATNAAVRNPQSTMAVQMVGSAKRVVLIAEFGKTSAGQLGQGTEGPWHVTRPIHGRFAGLSLPGSCGAKRLRLVSGTWRINSVFVRATLQATEGSG